MNQQLTPSQLAEISVISMSRREKLFRFARVIRQQKTSFFMFSNLEYMSPSDLTRCEHPASAFAAAAADPVLAEAGLTGHTVAKAQKFFELSASELHAFSCDCGGQITNDQMARRVEAIAAASA